MRFHGGIFQQFFDKKGELVIFSDRHGSIGTLRLKDFPETRGSYLKTYGEPRIIGPLNKGYYAISGQENLYRMDPLNPENTPETSLKICTGILKDFCKKEEGFHFLGNNNKILALGLGKHLNRKKENSKILILLDYISWEKAKNSYLHFKFNLKKVAISPDSRTLMVSFKENNLVSFIDIESKKIIKTYSNSDPIIDLKWVKNNRALSLSENGEAVFTNLKRL